MISPALMEQIKTPTPDPKNRIRQALRCLFPVDATVELRCLAVGGIARKVQLGWYDNHDWLADIASQIDAAQSPAGIYVTMNRVHSACLSRSANRICAMPNGTSNRDIVERFWWLLDFDPQPVSGVSASDEEIAEAGKWADRTIEYLEGELSFPPGLRAFSGNGIHLLYRCNVPIDETGTSLLSDCIKALSEVVKPKVKIDTTVIDPPRIVKLYGTVARKGMPSVERPHRRSMLLDDGSPPPAFDAAPVAPTELFEALAGKRKPAKARRSRSRRGPDTPRGDQEARNAPFDLSRWLTEKKVAVIKSEPWDGGVKHVLESCPFNPEHAGTSVCCGQTKTGTLYFRCQHNSCATNRWKEFRAAIEGKSPTDEAPVDVENPWSLALDFLANCYPVESGYGEPGEIALKRTVEHYVYWSRTEGRYQRTSRDAVRANLVRYLADLQLRVTGRLVGDVMGSVDAVTLVDRILPAWCSIRIVDGSPATQIKNDVGRLTVFKNGMVNIKEAIEKNRTTFRDLDPRWVDLSRIEYGYDPSARCERWNDFLADIFEYDGTRISLLQEAFGYSLWETTHLHSYFILTGSGRNGKSTVMNVLREVVGPDNVCSLDPKQLDDPVLCYNLKGKFVNLCADLGELDKVCEGTIKRVAGGDLITADRKYLESVEFRPFCKLWFATNVLPRFSDPSIGGWRRMVIIPFDKCVPIDAVNTGLFEELCEELPGILNWAIDGARRLARSGRFSDSMRCRQAVDTFRTECFPVLAYIDEKTESARRGIVTMGELFDNYVRWCNDNGMGMRRSIQTFAKHLREFRTDLEFEVRAGGNPASRTTIIRGLSWREEPGASHNLWNT